MLRLPNHTLLFSIQAKALNASGVEVIAVGIGSSVSNTELNAIASDSSHVFKVQDFDILNSIQNLLTNVTCHQADLRKCHFLCNNHSPQASIVVIFSSFQSFKGFPFLTKVHLFVLLFPNEGHPSLARRPFHFSLSLVKVSYSANRRPLICFFFSSINIFLFNGTTYRFPPII